MRDFAGKLFWNEDTRRFVAGIDVDGKSYDYGYTFLNCEAVHYGFAGERQAESIMQWLTGERTVAGDTSQGADIYHWRFGPRASTRRNIEWYGWFWNAPESIAWGDQVQDGGAVLGFAYHDLMARIKVRGADNAWTRLKETAKWFDEVQAVGGCREYYKDGTRGKLQGGGTPGGLGVDQEFFESILVPQVVIDGMLGFKARADGFEIQPRLPSEWPELTVTRIHFQRLILDVTARGDTITIKAAGRPLEPVYAYLPVGEYGVAYLDEAGKESRASTAGVGKAGDGIAVEVDGKAVVRFTRK